MTTAFASDHGGLDLKNFLVQALAASSEVLDLGIHTADSVDYPDMAASAVRAIRDGRAERAVLICGTGIGISIAANKFKGIRAALCHDEFTAEMSRRHNDSNVLALGGRVIGPDLAMRIVEKWLATPFDGGRHQRRVNKISAIEDGEWPC